MSSDVTIEATYGSIQEISVTYRDLDGGEAGDPIDVTGWSAELRLSTCDDTIYGTSRVIRTSGAGQVTVGTTNGLFTCSVPSASLDLLAPYLGSSGCIAPARWSLWVAPPAGTLYPIVRGWLFMQPVGSYVTPVEATTLAEATATTVTSIGSQGGTGPQGPQGPAGTGVEPTDGKTVTSATTEVTLGTISLSGYLNKYWVADIETTAVRSSDGAVNVWRHSVYGFTASDGTTTVNKIVQTVAAAAPSLGRPNFLAGFSSLAHRAKPGLVDTITWGRKAAISSTWSP